MNPERETPADPSHQNYATSVGVYIDGKFSTATVTPMSATPDAKWETVELSDNSDTLDPDESCIIVERSEGPVAFNNAIHNAYSEHSSTGVTAASDGGPSSIIVLDSPEKVDYEDDEAVVEPPRKKLILEMPESDSIDAAAAAAAATAAKEAERGTTFASNPPSSAHFNIFSSLLNVSRANSATPPATPIPSSNSFSAEVPSYSSVSSSSSSRSTSPRAATLRGDSSNIAATCWLPFCATKCEVETHHPLLRALSTCIGSISSSSSGESERDSALACFERVVAKWEAESEDGWTRTREINEMAKMKEYYYPLIHTATVSGNVNLVRWMLTKGFGDFDKPICSPLMQCFLNIDCAVRKIPERVKIFKEMIELMPSELSSSILDQADRPTSLLIVACGRASRDTSDRSYYAASLRNIVAFLIDNFDAETQKSVLQVRNSEGNTCVHELSRLDECLPILRKLYEISQKLNVVESVFKSANLRGKTALDLAADAGAIRLLMFLSPIVPASINRTPPPVRTPGDGAKDRSTSVTAPASVPTEPSSEPADGTDPKMPEAVSTLGTSNEINVRADESRQEVDREEETKEEDKAFVQLPVAVDDDEREDEYGPPKGETGASRELFRPLFRDDMKAEAKQKIVEKHLTEKRKLASDVNARMEKHGKNIDEIKSKIDETEEDTRKKIENLKVLYEVLLRTQQSIGVNDAKLKELNTQLVGERKTVAMHEKVSQELADFISVMDQLNTTLIHQVALNPNN